MTAMLQACPVPSRVRAVLPRKGYWRDRSLAEESRRIQALPNASRSSDRDARVTYSEVNDVSDCLH